MNQTIPSTEGERAGIIQQILARGFEDGLAKGLEDGRKAGIEEGIEEGIEKGIEKGIEEGIEEGIERGRQALLQIVATRCGEETAAGLASITDLPTLQERVLACLS